MIHYLCSMTLPENTVAALYKHYLARLELVHGTLEAAIQLDWLLEDFFGITKMRRMSHPEQRLSESELLRYHKAVQRLEEHEPVQYVLGTSEFYGMQLEVTPAVLIPRPETEELVEWMLEEVAKDAHILDIGTGSGCIPLALKKKLPNAHITATEISAEALEVASRNGKNLALEIDWIEEDVLADKHVLQSETFHAIVSNPPYIPHSDAQEMKANVVEYEPEIALFVTNTDPTLFYREIAEKSVRWLVPGGRLYFEIHRDFGKEILAILETLGYTEIELRKDTSNNDRLVAGTRP